jgi:hypothetical protein
MRAGGMGNSPLEELAAALRRLHRAAGEPSTHEIGKNINYSHTTVAQALRADHCPSWPVLHAVVTYLGGDPGQFRSFWIAVRDAEDPLPGLPASDDSLHGSAQAIDEKSYRGSDGESAGIVDNRVVLRWKTRLETVEFFDKGLALQWIQARAWAGNPDE